MVAPSNTVTQPTGTGRLDVELRQVGVSDGAVTAACVVTVVVVAAATRDQDRHEHRQGEQGAPRANLPG